MFKLFGARKEDIPESDIRNYSRIELLEILIKLSEENDELVEENRRLKEALESREIALSEAGNIAEAALGISKVFEAAQAAADAYLLNVTKQDTLLASQSTSVLPNAATHISRSERASYNNA